MPVASQPPSANGQRPLIVADLERLEDAMARSEARHHEEIAAVHPAHHADAVNLVHYVALRQSDVRSLQRRLGARGLSSLGRCEPHALATLESVRAELDRSSSRRVPVSLDFEAGRAALDRNTDALFGERPRGRVPHVMVTLPTEAASDYPLVRHLVASGMDVARINGAHDGPAIWEQMTRHVRRAADEEARPCRISMDLPGPKLRTGPLATGPRAQRIRPRRDQRGVPVTAAIVTLVAGVLPPGAPPGALPVDPEWLGRRRAGDEIDLTDTRGSHRRLRVVGCQEQRATVEVWDTTYLETGSELRCGTDCTSVGTIPALPEYHVLCAGDRLRLTRDLEPAAPWRHGQPGMARIGCTLAAVFDVITPGQQVVLDDGKLAGVVESVDGGEAVIRIETAGPMGSKLRAERGVNLPETEMALEVVTELDLPLLQVAAAHADMVALSFVRGEHDIDTMRSYLVRAGAEHLGLVLKIETEDSVRTTARDPAARHAPAQGRCDDRPR